MVGEQEFREGLQWGEGWAWSNAGVLIGQEQWVSGLYHGICREWSDDGQLIAEEGYEYSVRMWGRYWDEQGNPIREERLRKTDPDYETLRIYRTGYRQAGLDGDFPPVPVPVPVPGPDQVESPLNSQGHGPRPPEAGS